MIVRNDLIVIVVGYALGLAIGFIRGVKAGKDKFWKMPSASWRARK